MKITACKKGLCNVLHDNSATCDYREQGKLYVCNFMQQMSGRCLHGKASTPVKHRNANQANCYFRKLSVAGFKERMMRK